MIVEKVNLAHLVEPFPSHLFWLYTGKLLLKSMSDVSYIKRHVSEFSLPF